MCSRFHCQTPSHFSFKEQLFFFQVGVQNVTGGGKKSQFVRLLTDSVKWDSSSWERGRICQVPVPFLFTDWRRDSAPTDGAPHKSDKRGKEKRRRKIKPTRFITFIVRANETGRPECQIGCGDHPSPRKHWRVLYLWACIKSGAEQDRWLEFVCRRQFFFPQTLEKRVGVTRRRSGR